MTDDAFYLKNQRGTRNQGAPDFGPDASNLDTAKEKNRQKGLFNGRYVISLQAKQRQKCYIEGLIA